MGTLTNPCVCCGKELPEGRQVCTTCEIRSIENEKSNFFYWKHNRSTFIQSCLVRRDAVQRQ